MSSSRRAQQQAPADEGAERVLGIRRMGAGQQYEIKWRGVQETTWEAASRVRKEIPQLVQEFEQRQQQQPPAAAATGASGRRRAHAGGSGRRRSRRAAIGSVAAERHESAAGASAGAAGARPGTADEGAGAAAAAAARFARSARVCHLRSLSAAGAAFTQRSGSCAAPTSRFANKEPRAQDLREYDGASGAKLDAWLDELGAAVRSVSTSTAVRRSTSLHHACAEQRCQWWTGARHSRQVAAR